MQSLIKSPDGLLGSEGLILGFEIELDLHIVRVVEENLPTGAIGHLVHAVGHAFAGEVPLRCLKTATTERNMIDDT